MKMKESVTEEQKLELYHLLKDRYLIGDLLKKGEHSRIYRAYDTVLDQEITIKEFVPENPDMAETDTGNFIEEAGKFFGVYEYQGIAEVTDVFRDEEHAYMAIEYLPGKNLREYLNAEKKGQITIEEAWTLLFPVLDTVSWMHSNGMVHGGIRMSRLIFDENDRLCLTGIGDCFLRNRESEANGPWTDVRAVSEILYECLTGKSPLQAGCLWNKKKIRSVSIWTTVSSRVDETLLRELNYGIGGGCFGFYALAEQLGMQNEPLAVYLGAIQSVWGESWLNLTEKYQKEAYLDEEHAFLTRKQWRNILNITGIFLVSIAVAGCVGFWYTHTHERQILEWQIQKDRTKYHRISGKETDGFAIGDIHLKKLMEQTLGISLEEKNRNSYSEMPYQESCTYASPEKAGKEQIEIFSDKEDRRVNSCEVVLSKEEMELFFQEIFSQIIPETYLTEEEIERTFDRTQDGFYRFDAHGKFQMTLWKKKSYGETEKEQEWYHLSLTACAREPQDEKEAAGSYARDSKEYREFMDFVKKHAVKTEMISDTIIYKLKEEAVRNWNQPSNVPLLKKTRTDFMRALEKSGCSFEIKSEKDIFQVTDAGIGALKAEFVREVRIETTEGERIFLQYDFLSERIVQICLGSVDSAREWNYGLGAELIGALSDDNRKSEEKLAKELKQNASELEASSLAQENCGDLSWMILTDDDRVPRLILAPHGLLDDESFPYAASRWQQKGED